jgi:tetratricopeptide (TPR) repeat protein
LTFINREKRFKAFCWLGSVLVLFFLFWLGSEPLQFFIKMLDNGMINTAGIAVGGDSSITAEFKQVLLKMGNVRALAIPFYFVLPVMALLFLIRNDSIFKTSIKILRTTLGIWILICVCSYMYYENKLYKEDQFHVVTGFLDTEQGFGKSNKFFNGMADYVIDNYAGEEVYNTYNMGGFLLWRWYGKRRVFIDGRSAVYDGDFYTDYIKNNAATYINKIPLTKGIMNLLVDRDRVLFFLKSGWYPVAFDACMVILHRPQKLDSSFGMIPKFFEGERPIYGDSRILGNSLEHLDRKALGVFLNQATYHMLLQGRIKDTRIFMDKIQKIHDAMPLAVQNVLNERKRFVGQLVGHFGEKNHLVLGMLCKKIFNKVKGIEYHKAMGEAFLALNIIDKAEVEFLQAHNYNKEDVQILAKLGDISYKLKKYKNSVFCYQQAIKLKPQEPSYYNNIALPMLRLGGLKEAISACNKAIELKPDYYHGYYNKGMIYVETKNFIEAKKSFNQVLKINPKFKPAADRLRELETVMKGKS